MQYRNYLNSIYDSVTDDLPAFAFLDTHKMNSQNVRAAVAAGGGTLPSAHSLHDVCGDDTQPDSFQCRCNKNWRPATCTLDRLQQQQQEQQQQQQVKRIFSYFNQR